MLLEEGDFDGLSYLANKHGDGKCVVSDDHLHARESISWAVVSIL
jgi:hypothetical protein